jgi:hypothetical protein
VRRIERTHRSIFRASLRAGTITDTSGGSAGTTGDSFASDGEPRARHNISGGPSTQGQESVIQL